MDRARAEAQLEEGAAYLMQICPVWARELPALLPLPLRARDDGFGALRDAIVSQQLSTSAAASISQRLIDLGIHDEDAVIGADDAALRACGLSQSKLRYLRALSEARIDWLALRDQPDDQVIETLTALPGIGRWTAEIYLNFALLRPDVFAAADLALAEAARLLYGLPERPKERRLRELAEPWRPWRSVAARALWAYYHVEKGREGIR